MYIVILLLALQQARAGGINRLCPCRANTLDVTDAVTEATKTVAHTVEVVSLQLNETIDRSTDKAVLVVREVNTTVKQLSADTKYSAEQITAALNRASDTLKICTRDLTTCVDTNTARICKSIHDEGERVERICTQFHVKIPEHIATCKKEALDFVKQSILQTYQTVRPYLACAGMIQVVLLYNGNECSIASVMGTFTVGALVHYPVNMIKDLLPNKALKQEEKMAALRASTLIAIRHCQHELGKLPEQFDNGISQMDQFLGSWDVVRNMRLEKYEVKKYNNTCVVKNDETGEEWMITAEPGTDGKIEAFVLSKRGNDAWAIEHNTKMMIWTQKVEGDAVPNLMMWVKIPPALEQQ